MLISPALATALLILVMALLGVGIHIIFRSPVWGVWLFAGATALGWTFVDWAPGLPLGGILIYPMDGASVLLFCAALLRLMAVPDGAWRWRAKWFITLGVMLLASFLTGIATNGFKGAGLEFRPFFQIFAALAFGLVFGDLIEVRRAFWTVFWMLGFFLAGLALIRWGMVGAGIRYAEWTTSTKGPNKGYLRVLNAAQTLFLAEVVLISLATEHARKFRVLAWIALGMVVVLMHRTIWVVTIIGLGWLLLHRRRDEEPSHLNALLGPTLGLLACVGIVMLFGTLRGLIGSTVEEAFDSRSSSLQGRLGGWIELLDPKDFTPFQWVLGKPFGSSYVRVQGQEIVRYNPHSQYVAWLLRTGIIGLLSWCILWFKAARQKGGGSWIPLLVVMQVVYGITYIISPEQGLLLGVAFVGLPRMGDQEST